MRRMALSATGSPDTGQAPHWVSHAQTGHDVVVGSTLIRGQLLADGACQREKNVEGVVLPGIVRSLQYTLFGRKDVHSLPPRIKSARPCGQKPHEPRRGGSKPLAPKRVKAYRGSQRITLCVL